MKIKALSRNEREWDGTLDGTGSKVAAPRRQQHNPSAQLHPFERAREEKRALNAAKLERVFAQPFLAALSDHVDAPYAVARTRNSTASAASCAADGSLILWNLPQRSARWVHDRAHSAFARGVCFTSDDASLLSCSDDKTIKLWRAHHELSSDDGGFLNDYDFRSRIPGAFAGPSNVRQSGSGQRQSDGVGRRYEPQHVYLSACAVNAVDASWTSTARFASCNDAVEIWDASRPAPLQRLSWGADAVNSLRFNPVETNLLASAGSDRSVAIYDLRMQTAVRKVVLSMRTNALAWNPIEAFTLALANEDHNVYTYDIRKLAGGARGVHTGHVRAVMSVDYSPTGQEIVSGSYDQTVRLFNLRDAHFGRRSRDVYHTKRMQRVFGVTFSADAQLVLSASDDGDVRLWKAQAAQPMKPLLPKERDALQYAEKLKRRYRHVPEVRRILNHRHVPKPIFRMQNNKQIMKASQRRKTDNRRRHSAPGAEPHIPEKQRHVLKELE